MGRLDGKRAVVTGAASGIGEATARLFVAEGATVVLADTDQLRGKRIAAELGELARFVATDVSREQDVDQAVATSVEVFGGLDVMFNNAGVPGSAGNRAGDSGRWRAAHRLTPAQRPDGQGRSARTHQAGPRQ